MWEYLIVDADKMPPCIKDTYAEIYREFLNKYGKEGWELCGVDDGTFYFKRSVPYTVLLPY